MLDTLPPEVFGLVLQIAVRTWGIGFLPPVRLVNSTCNDIISCTPSLWGILSVKKPLSWPVLNQQLAKAKQSDIRITFPKKSISQNDKHFSAFFTRLLAVSNNWVLAELSSDLLAKTSASGLGRLQVLTVRGGRDVLTDSFFDSQLPSLHSLTAFNLVGPWIMGFLNPRITDFRFGNCGLVNPDMIRNYLVRLTHVHTLAFEGFRLPAVFTAHPVILAQLHNTEMDQITNVPAVLMNMRARALRSLSLRNCTGHISVFLAEWSQPHALPEHLQSLELTHVLSPADIPFLVGFLARLPALVRLIITYYNSDTFDEMEKMLPRALATCKADGSWLCPALMHLCLDASLQVVDAIPIARARGNGANALADGPPTRLRSVQVPLCAGGSPDEAAKFRSYFADPDEEV